MTKAFKKVAHELYLENTNRICSPLFALFIPVNVTSFSDVFFPWTVHYALGTKQGLPKCLAAAFLDLVTLIFRVTLLIPRGLYKCLQLPAIKLHHPVRYTLTAGVDQEFPVIVKDDNKEFYFALESMHEVQAHQYFENARQRPRPHYKVDYSEDDIHKPARVMD